MAVGLLVALALPSYATTMLRPSDTGYGVRSVEWLRDHGFAWLVADVENVYYSLNAPAKGGKPLRALPQVGTVSPAAVARARRALQPPAVRPAIRPALAGEGVWHAVGPRVTGAAPVLVTRFRSEPDYPRLVAGVAWIDASRTRLVLYPGRYEPPAAGARGPMQVPASRRRDLLAAFNSGFKLEDARGAASSRPGAPTHRWSGARPRWWSAATAACDVVDWRGPRYPGLDVVAARQNLPLIVDRGRPGANLGAGSLWGTTVNNAVRVWRSGVGIDRHGNVLYAAAPDQTVSSLARILIRAGAVRAMEMDINSYWTSFISYARRGAGHPAKLLGSMQREATRYMTSSDRDFFAVYARPGTHGP